MVCHTFDATSFIVVVVFFFFKQKTAYEMRISDWSSDVCSSDLLFDSHPHFHADDLVKYPYRVDIEPARRARAVARPVTPDMLFERWDEAEVEMGCGVQFNALYSTDNRYLLDVAEQYPERVRSEEHTSELQSLMRTSYAVFCLEKK